MAGRGTNIRNEQRGLIGSRIRRRRLFLQKTQAALAKSLGITYQQFQKYEQGLNSVPEHRLRDLASILEVAPEYFSAASAQKADSLERFVVSPEGVDLNRAVAGLTDAARARLVTAVGLYCNSVAGADDADPLTSWLRKVTVRRGSAELAANTGQTIHAAKVELARHLAKTLRRRSLTQAAAAQILRTNQARLSTLTRGDVRGVSFDKLLRYLMLLGWNVGIEMAPRSASEPGEIGIDVRK